MPYTLQPVGQLFEVPITRVEIKTAKEVFTTKEGEFKAQFSKPTDKVLVVFARAPKSEKDTKIGTFNIPTTSTVHAKAQLHKFLSAVGADVKSWSDDFRELKGRMVSVIYDESGFISLHGERLNATRVDSSEGLP